MNSSALLSQQLHDLPDSLTEHPFYIPGATCAVMSRHLLFADGTDRFVEVSGDVSALFGPDASIDAVMQDPTAIWRYFRRTDMGVLLGNLRKSARSQEPVSMDAMVDIPGRGARQFRFRMYAVFFEGDAILSTGVVSDITDLNLGPDTQYGDDPASLGSFSGSAVSHGKFLHQLSAQLRTSLNTMQGFAQLLQMNPNMSLAAEQRERLTNIELACRRMEELIDSIRELSLTEPQSNLPTEPLDVVSAVHEAVTLVTPLADATGVTFVVHTPDGPGGVMAEPRALGQVLRNVFSNAVKYNRPNGRVDITIRLQAGRCRIAVADEGKGMTAQEQDQLFQPFKRFNTGAGAAEGHGLGLAITRSLMYRMAGSIGVWSNPGRGTTFEIEFERAMSWPQPPDSPSIAGQLHAVGDSSINPEAELTVLCVEDDRMNLLLNQKTLERVPGTQVRIARDGRTAFDMIREFAPDLVISDMKLPGMSGRELIRAVNEQGLAPQTTWIAISADSRSETREAALREGFSAYWLKPVNVRDLMAAIKALVALTRGDADPKSTRGLDEPT